MKQINVTVKLFLLYNFASLYSECSSTFIQETLGGLLEAVKTEDEALAHHFKKSEEWATVEEMIAAHGCKYICLLCVHA